MNEPIKPLGTVLPDLKALARNDRFQDAEREKRTQEAERDPELAGCERRIVSGEVRFYRTSNVWALAE